MEKLRYKFLINSDFLEILQSTLDTSRQMEDFVEYILYNITLRKPE